MDKQPRLSSREHDSHLRRKKALAVLLSATAIVGPTLLSPNANNATRSDKLTKTQIEKRTYPYGAGSARTLPLPTDKTRVQIIRVGKKREGTSLSDVELTHTLDAALDYVRSSTFGEADMHRLPVITNLEIVGNAHQEGCYPNDELMGALQHRDTAQYWYAKNTIPIFYMNQPSACTDKKEPAGASIAPNQSQQTPGFVRIATKEWGVNVLAHELGHQFNMNHVGGIV